MHTVIDLDSRPKPATCVVCGQFVPRGPVRKITVEHTEPDVAYIGTVTLRRTWWVCCKHLAQEKTTERKP